MGYECGGYGWLGRFVVYLVVGFGVVWFGWVVDWLV